MNDTVRHDAAGRDGGRQPLPSDTTHFTMTVEEAARRFADAGLPRSIRSIQRYCQRGHLTCTTVDTEIADMYVIDPNSVERRIQELQQIEIITRAPEMSRRDAPGRDLSRHDATVRDTSRQEVSSEKIETYEHRIKDLEEKAMHLEIDKRAREQIINMLKEDRESLFAQLSDHVRTITDQARLIGQLESRLELGPGRARSEEVERGQYAPPREQAPYAPRRAYEQPQEPQRRPPESPREEYARIEYPPRYSSHAPRDEGDNAPLGNPGLGVQ